MKKRMSALLMTLVLAGNLMPATIVAEDNVEDQAVIAEQIAAEEDPHAENERLRVEAEAAAAAEEAAGGETGNEPVEYGQVAGGIVG